MSSPTPLTRDQDAFLRAFIRATLAVPKLVDDDLQRTDQISISEYFVLVHLSEAPDQRLRMSDLAGAAAMSLSGMTRLVQKLEASHLVRRERSGEDGRGWFAVLAPEGLDRLQRAWPAHLASTHLRIFDHLTGVDLPAVTAALEAMAGGCGAPSSGT